LTFKGENGKLLSVTLKTGTQLGPYEITALIGSGGMGEVYRAKDTRLDRVVAIKVLPEELSADSRRRQRLEREAKAISRLSHAHVCTLFDIGRAQGVEFLVMEYVDGESLASRLSRGALPIDEVLMCGVQMADALATAHRQGIVHRDLKPGNVMLTKSGVKLLDFGLARMIEPPATDAATGQMPTLTTALTEEGSIIGTYQYMAPEQVEGGTADARTDIFALGCVLYEMATGQRTFSGSTHASLISSILREEPAPISAIQPLAPPALAWTVQTCLRKDPDQRWQSAVDVANELLWVAEEGSKAGVPAAGAMRRRVRERVLLATSVLCAALFIVAGVAWWRQTPQPSIVVRSEIVPPAELTQVESPRISPDGRHIAFWGTSDDGTRRIWLRAVDDLDAHPLAGTEDAQVRPFWSPDSRYLAFMADGKLKKISISGGPPQIVC
jgi:predicted Ser/Thr protein kinase